MQSRVGESRSPIGRVAILGACLIVPVLGGCGGGGSPSASGPSPLDAETRATPTDLDFDAPPVWVLLTVELPQGHDPSLIDMLTVRVNDWIRPDPGFQNLVDLDSDGLTELQIRVPGFCFVQSLLCVFCDPAGELTNYLVSGEVGTGGSPRRFLAWGAVTVTGMPDNFCGAQPYIQNESFEYSFGPDYPPDCWQYFDADDADEDDWTEGWYGFGWIEPERVQGFVHDGEYSARITVPGFFSKAGRSGFKQRVAVFGGERNAFWAWVYVDGLTTGATHPDDRVDMEFSFYDRSGNLLPTPGQATNVNPIRLDTFDWDQMFTADFTVPADACVMEISLLLILNAPPLGDISVWFDDAL
jgi:hypothetical protein